MSESFVEDDSSKTDLETSTSDQNASNNIESIKRSDSATDPELKEKHEALKLLVDRYEKQLQEERSYRQELERSFEKRSKELEEATQKHIEAKNELEHKINNIERNFDHKLKQTVNKFSDLALKNNQQREGFNELSDRYQRLTGHYEKTANELREEQIQLPQTVTELQFEFLKLLEALIASRATHEHSEEDHASQIEVLNTELNQAQALYQTHQAERRSSPDNNELRQTIGDLEKRLVESQNESMVISRSLDEYRQKCSQLQLELNTSEVVQKDFVKLSQQLQVQLEVIRQGDHELRWQFADDHKRCNACNAELKHKINCKHCGKIFCPKCTSNVIPVGSNKAHVCEVCNTLLSKNAAPFFSSK